MDYGFETGFWSLLFPLMGGYSRNYHSEWYCRWRQTWNLCKDYFEKTSVQYWLGWFKYWHSKKDEFWFNGDGKSSIFPNCRTCTWTFWERTRTPHGEGECDESSDKTPSKCIESSSNLQGLVLLEAESRSPVMKKSLVISHLWSPSQIRRQQAEFWRQITAAGDTSTAGIFLCVSIYLSVSYTWWPK